MTDPGSLSSGGGRYDICEKPGEDVQDGNERMGLKRLKTTMLLGATCPP